MSRITLTASMRSNLLSLQNTAKLQDTTSLKLATGQKVNSAIDNPSAYYTAQALSNRAHDLDSLLDAMDQGAQTIKAATTALESGVQFLEQAAAVASTALETAEIPSKAWLAKQDNVAAVVSNWAELKAALDSGQQGDIVIYGQIKCEDTITLQAGQNLVGVGKYGADEPDIDKFSELYIDLNSIGKNTGISITGDADISDLSIKAKPPSATTSRVIDCGTANVTINNLDLLMDTQQATRGMDGIYKGNITLEGINNINDVENSKNSNAFTACASVTNNGILNIDVSGYALVEASLFVTKGNSITNIITPNRVAHGSSGALFSFEDNSLLNIKSNEFFMYATVNINDNAVINGIGRELFHTQASQATTIAHINSANAQINFTGKTLLQNYNNLLTFTSVAGAKVNWNNQEYTLPEINSRNDLNDTALKAQATQVTNTTTPTPDLDWLSAQSASRSMEYQERKIDDDKQYNEIINQYDTLINDSSYKGVNLLQQQDLKVNFNEDNSSYLEVKGYDVSSSGLGLNTKAWQTADDVLSAVNELTSAINRIRNISAELGNNYTILNTRQNFTENLINVLEEGADNLTLADMNEESANELALQTRQQLAINALSLAAQSSQSVLKLF